MKHRRKLWFFLKLETVHRYVLQMYAANTLDIIIVCRATVSYLHATAHWMILTAPYNVGM